MYIPNDTRTKQTGAAINSGAAGPGYLPQTADPKNSNYWTDPVVSSGVTGTAAGSKSNNYWNDPVDTSGVSGSYVPEAASGVGQYTPTWSAPDKNPDWNYGTAPWSGMEMMDSGYLNAINESLEKQKIVMGLIDQVKAGKNVGTEGMNLLSSVGWAGAPPADPQSGGTSTDPASALGILQGLNPVAPIETAQPASTQTDFTNLRDALTQQRGSRFWDQWGTRR